MVPRLCFRRPSSKKENGFFGTGIVATDETSSETERSRAIGSGWHTGPPAIELRWRSTWRRRSTVMKLTETREITPYKWVHPDEER
jgi:hypothetical protein